jgi:short subunit dehydrogenase-like uncharacterized protein
MARELGLEHRVASLHEPAALDAALRGVRLVLNVAGPFSTTAAPIADACLRAGCHYLDVSGEVFVIEALHGRDREAQRLGITIMPAVGCDVVATDSLIAYVSRKLPSARRLALGVSGLAFASRGSWETLVEHAGFGVLRRDGELKRVPVGSLRRLFDFGAGERTSLGVVWGDVGTAYYTTGIPDIEVYFEATPLLELIVAFGRMFGPALRSAPAQAWLKAHSAFLPVGPTDEQRAAHQMTFVAEARDDSGRVACARLRTPEAYTLTALTSVALVRRVLDGDYEIGFQTPARVYGPDLALGFPGVHREDVALEARA